LICDILATAQQRKRFFIFFPRNPLKSPDSAKEIQGNASFFPWIYLVLLGFIWPPKPKPQARA
jgi:hypothetical protein